MRNRLSLVLASLIFLASCSPRDYLTRRLAADLLVASDGFQIQQRFILHTGIASAKDYPSPEYLVLQHHGWLIANSASCPQGVTPAPCWNVLLTPYGVETVRGLVPAEDAAKTSISISVARRELIAVTGISKGGDSADVEFIWKWSPLNEFGSALYSGDLHYKSTVGFRKFDDGWRLVESTPHPEQTLDDAFKNAEPTQ